MFLVTNDCVCVFSGWCFVNKCRWEYLACNCTAGNSWGCEGRAWSFKLHNTRKGHNSKKEMGQDKGPPVKCHKIFRDFWPVHGFAPARTGKGIVVLNEISGKLKAVLRPGSYAGSNPLSPMAWSNLWLLGCIPPQEVVQPWIDLFHACVAISRVRGKDFSLPCNSAAAVQRYTGDGAGQLVSVFQHKLGLQCEYVVSQSAIFQ